MRAWISARTASMKGVVDRAGQRVELGELVEVPEHLVGVVDDGLHETSQGREALAQVPRSGWSASRCEVLHELQKALRPLDALRKPVGCAVTCRLLAFAFDQSAKPHTPLVEALDDARATRD